MTSKTFFSSKNFRVYRKTKIHTDIVLDFIFSDFSYVDKSLSVTEFICEWEVRLQSALAAGCQYSDAVLAFKLLHNSELDNSDIQQSKHVLIAIWTYDLYGPVRIAFDAGKSITRASGKGLDPGSRYFVGPCEMASSR
jgi:hypothetical protein